jgi:large subunit ribosomal protein L17
MKKNVTTFRLNRDTTARKALFKGLMIALVEREEIETTKAKASAVRRIFEKLITTAKEGTINARRQVQTVLQDSKLVKKLVDEIAPRYADVKGGYTKLVMVGARRGDGAFMVRLGLTKKTEKILVKKDDKKETKAKPKTAVTKIAAPRVEKVNVSKVAARKAGSRGGDR